MSVTSWHTGEVEVSKNRDEAMSGTVKKVSIRVSPKDTFAHLLRRTVATVGWHGLESDREAQSLASRMSKARKKEPLGQGRLDLRGLKRSGLPS